MNNDTEGLELSQCAGCRHKDPTGAKCSAYPGGIPEIIIRNEADHRQEQDGDRGIRWEPLYRGNRHPMG